ncbi:MAG: MBL fold metallo-hydrolase [Burkholderiaceae bacterium]|nr:MBL fold metallo-hydrolase [Burkholderiaceae bacterium]
MLFRRLETPGLAHRSYVLECGGGQAVVVDPRRDIGGYLALAREYELSITYILETHRQEDFEYGSASLAAATGAVIVTGDHPLFGRSDRPLRDGTTLMVGTTRIVVHATPGHTPEGVSYVVYPENSGSTCWGVFTGDALFVGATGRTDLADPGKAGENAGVLFDSVHQKLAPLGDQALVFAAHGAGSACGSNIADRDDSTLGLERRTNPVFTLSRADFVRHKKNEHLPRPPYFAHMERVNLEAGRPVPDVARIAALQPAAFQKTMRNAVVIDTRSPDAFASSHLAGSYNIWLEGVPGFAGWIANERSKLLLVVEAVAQIDTAALSLVRVGIDGTIGFLAGGVPAWRENGLPVASTGVVSASEAAAWLDAGRARVLDVRDDDEWRAGHIGGAMHIYVGDLESKLPAVDTEERLIVHCSVGHRAGLATSILARAGFTDVYNMLGGMDAWKALGLPVE